MLSEHEIIKVLKEIGGEVSSEVRRLISDRFRMDGKEVPVEFAVSGDRPGEILFRWRGLWFSWGQETGMIEGILLGGLGYHPGLATEIVRGIFKS